MKRLKLGLSILVLLAVAATSAWGATWGVPDDFATIQLAIDSPAVEPGDTIRVSPGNHAGAMVTKQVAIRGEGGATIDSGPVHPSGFVQGFRLMAGSDGTTLSHLRFTVDFPVMNGAAVDDVAVTHCDVDNALQGISNWRGNGWEISHNKFFDLRTSCGGGIAVLIGDFSGGEVRDNLVSHNRVMGVLHVPTDDCGGYSGTGIVLYADFRGGRAGAEAISDNRVVKNKVSLVSDLPEVVDVVAIELTDTRNDPENYSICDNAVGFNDLRGTTYQIALTPEELEDCNSISRNLGNNRGHGMHPSAFHGN